MVLYCILVGILSFVVNSLLLLGTNRLMNDLSRLRYIAIGAIIGAAHNVVCVATEFQVLGGTAWYLAVLFLSGTVAFGISVNAVGKSLLYMLLSMALSWLTAGSGGGIWIGLAGAVFIFFLCMRLVEQKKESGSLTSVELNYQNNRVCIWALRDTGNKLIDPLSGNPVLVVGPKVAEKLLGLTKQQLEHPIESIGHLPGLRLIPYRTVGQNNGLLLGVRLPEIRIGGWRGSLVVAFAPCGLGENQTYQGLIGGNI